MLGKISLGGTKKKVAAGIGVLVLAVAGTGAAIGATGNGTPQEESKAVIAAAATDLGVSSATSPPRSRRRSLRASMRRSRPET